MVRRISRQLLVGLSAATLAIAGLAGSSSAAFPGPNGQIAFASYRDSDYEIYSIAPDGTGETRLTNSPGLDGYPAWSPDGKKIVFVSGRDGNNEVYVMNADGSGQTRLTNNSATDSSPAWSPDGKKIAFMSDRDGNNEVYVMNADGSGQTRLTNEPSIEDLPAWSPDGGKIAFASDRGSNFDIYVMNPDGSAQTRLTTAPAIDTSPSWSPDGQKIAYQSYPNGNADVFVVNADGSGQTQLTSDGSNNADPAWSPDGQKIAFTHGCCTGEVIYVMNADGSGQTNLTESSAPNFYPDWQPLPPTDTTPPTITASFTPAANAAGWWSAPPTVSFDCSDAESGIASCPAPVSVTTEGAGQVVSGTATDKAGNSASASVTINLDLTNPSVSCPPVPSFPLHQAGATLTATITDSLSGSAAPTVSAPVPTGTLGLGSANVTGSDVAGRSTSVGCPYRIAYQVQAFAAPVDHPPTINTAKAGRAIPVAWRLTDAAGAPIADPTSFVSVTSGSTSCSTSDPTDDVEAYSGSSGLQYLGNGWWQFNWKTPSSFAGHCRVLRLNLSSGQDGPTAYFRFR